MDTPYISIYVYVSNTWMYRDNYDNLLLDIYDARYHDCQTIIRYGLTDRDRLSDQRIRRSLKDWVVWTVRATMMPMEDQ